MKKKYDLPKLEDVDANYAEIADRCASFDARLAELRQRERELRTQVEAEAGSNSHQDRVNALISGAANVPTPAVDQLAACTQERRDLEDARSELGHRLRGAYLMASRKACEMFRDPVAVTISNGMKALAELAEVRLEIDAMQRACRAQGVEPFVHDPFEILFGESMAAGSRLAVVLKEAARDGQIGKLPEGLR